MSSGSGLHVGRGSLVGFSGAANPHPARSELLVALPESPAITAAIPAAPAHPWPAQPRSGTARWTSAAAIEPRHRVNVGGQRRGRRHRPSHAPSESHAQTRPALAPLEAAPSRGGEGRAGQSSAEGTAPRWGDAARGCRADDGSGLERQRGRGRAVTADPPTFLFEPLPPTSRLRHNKLGRHSVLSFKLSQ